MTLEHNHSDNYHTHSHGTIDSSIVATKRGIWTVKWSFVILFFTSIFQVFIVLISGSVGLLADTIHNFADASTAIPLGIAFYFSKLKANKRFTYGYGRIEDLAGIIIILIISISGIIAGYESIDHFLHPMEVKNLLWVIIASIIGFIGNEGVALFRIKIGKEIGSAALVADGYHARVDGLTSLAVLVGAIGVWLGYPLTDPIIGIVITISIIFIVWDSIKAVFTRVLDGVEPKLIEEIDHISHDIVKNTPLEIKHLRARWLGHSLHIDLQTTSKSGLSIKQGNQITKEIEHELNHHIPNIGEVIISIEKI